MQDNKSVLWTKNSATTARSPMERTEDDFTSPILILSQSKQIEGEVMEFKGPDCIALAGFSLHAARRVGGEAKRNLSQLIHYTARPPLAKDRLKRTATGDILARSRVN
jgi:hypothetical protein